ncbi:oxidoreductase alpha (molybdopterin) subunit [Synechococcus sp. PCC 7335]|uniref:FdhF/YdeP family oxidoreductase n=1 Tax=Synechococcus sp. (strain ATCC 29403 / PCC 7335) TaxID=91464 RepID=UPI00017EC04B|nr:FdhF/YdeP family oxidoreductase [Synechococcus sp. PCC 7335]EDX87362.1 oxidoreductase alpha (molybdopterin) subunit [Synechococcus sp. PCC 7335]
MEDFSSSTAGPTTETGSMEISLSEQPAEGQLEKHSGKEIGGGLPVIEYWAKNTLSSKGLPVWKTLFHKSACLSCAWGTGGQKGGFTNEAGEKVQRCMKSMESIIAELQPPVAPHFFETHCIDHLRTLSSMEADRLGRLSFPVMLTAGESHYQRITWKKAYELMAEAFCQPPTRVAAYSSGRSSNEAAYILQLMMRLLGSNNLADCSDLCHRPSTTGLSSMFGSGTSTVSLESLKQTDCVVLVGSNAPANHPRLMNELIKVRDRGGTILVVNPIREVGLVKYGSPSFPVKSLVPGSDIANLFLQPVPGSDLALFVGIQKSLIERDLIDRDFLKAHTEGWEAVIAQAQRANWETLTEICGIPKADIEAAATLIAQARKVVFAWAMGITHQANGTDNVCSIANTALLTGNIGKMGAGVMPIRGHSNVQGFGSMGVKNDIKPALREALEKITGRSLKREPGYHARALIEAADQEQVDTLFCLGGNLYAANPDLTQAERALSKIDTIIYVATKPNLGHFHGLGQKQTLILPVFNRFENPHKTTVESGNNFVRLNDEGKSHLNTADLVSEVHLLTELAHRIHGNSPIDWRKLQDTRYVRELIAKTIPGYKKIGEIDKTKAEFTIAGRIFTTPRFKTDSGKAKMPLTPLPDLSLSVDSELGSQPGTQLTLITARSYRQHNTIVYGPGDKYRGIPHRQCILMNPKDIKAGGFLNHQRVTIQGSAGTLSDIEIISGAIRPGAALMFYPEANVLMKAEIDPKSHTPAFKRVPILVHE